MSEIAVRNDMAGSIEWARTLAPSRMLPKAFQDNPANLLYAAEYADALEIPRINALNEIHVVQGRPTASANLMAALVRRAGHKLRVRGDNQTATASLVRSDDPDFEYAVTWTLARAKTAGLLGKDVWKQYPEAMLRSRAISEVIRQGASEVLMGVYTPEELGANVFEDGRPSEPMPATVESGMDKLKERMSATETVDTETGVIEDAEIVEEPTAMDGPVTDGTWSRMGELMKAQGLVSAVEMWSAMSRIAGRKITAREDLTEHEALTININLSQVGHEPETLV